jgi:hypothetical protein
MQHVPFITTKFLIMKISTGFKKLLPALLLMAGLACGTLQAQTTGTGNLSSQKVAAKTTIDKADEQKAALALIPNKGQWPAWVLYKADLPGGQAIVTKDGMIAGIFDRQSLVANSNYYMAHENWQKDRQGAEPVAPVIKGHGWKIKFVNSNSVAKQQITDAGKSNDYYNYLGNATGKDATNVHSYSEITYKNVYNGVDVRYYGTADNLGLENDIIINPGADAAKVAFKPEGIDNYEVNKEGSLVLHTGVEDVIMAAPFTYTLNEDGQRTTVQSKYRQNADKSIAFELGSYDHSQKLVIDPIVMRWATWISTAATSGNGGHNHAIDLDPAGNIYTGGLYTGTTLITVGAFQSTSIGSQVLFFGKYTEPTTPGGAGTRVWQTYLGNAAGGLVQAIAYGPDGYLYAAAQGTGTATNYGTGFATPSFTNRPVSTAPFCVIKIDAAGAGALVRCISTNRTTDRCNLYSINLQPTGSGTFNVVVSGIFALTAAATTLNAASGDFSAPQKPDGTALSLAASSTAIGVASFSNDFATINYAKIIGTGNASNVSGRCQAMDAAGNIYISGNVADAASNASFNNPSTQTTQVVGGAIGEGYLLKLNTSGAPLVFRYFNGTANTNVLCINAASDNTSIVIGGITGGLAAANLTGTPFDNTVAATDFFVARLPLSLATTTWGTYLGGTGGAITLGENMMGLSTDANNDVYILGYTQSSDFPVTANAVQNSINLTGTGTATNRDAIFSKLTANGQSLLYSTFLGGGTDDFDPLGNNGVKFYNCRIYLAISSTSDDFPLTNGAVTTGAVTGAGIANPILMSMANPPDVTAYTITPASQSIACGGTAANITATTPAYVIASINRNGAVQTNGTATAYPGGLPAVGSGFQWQSSIDYGSTWTNIAGATALTLTSAQIGTVVQDTRFRMILNGDACNRFEDPIASISAGGDPVAAPAASCISGNTTFSANATGTGTLTYAWTLPAATTRPNPGNVANFVLTGTLSSDAGIYQLTVTNAGGCKTTKTYKYNVANCSFIVVPVKLAAFDARKDDSGTKSLLSWMVTEEINTTGYTVQRSRNGTDWDEIGYVAAQGTGSQQANYHFTDASPAPGINYYRLLITDVNGAGSYSPIRMLKYDNLQQAPISVYPNPASSAVVITGVSNGEVLSLYSSDGRLVATQAATGYTQSLDISRLAAGTYILKAESGSAAPRTLKVVKQ